MTLRALGVAAILCVFTSSAFAGGVDWSDYIEKPGSSRPLPAQKSAAIPDAEPAAAPTKAKPKAKAKRVARSSKAKTAKAKAKSRAKAKRRR
jgi:hypothetical protein